MTRLDPLTQSVTALPAQGQPRPLNMPANSFAPAEVVVRFVAAAEKASASSAYESGYAAARVRQRMSGHISGLSDLGSRLSDAAAGLHATDGGHHDPADMAALAAARAEARTAELRAAAAALNVAISGARSDVASVLKQMQAELSAAVDSLAKGEAASGTALDGAVASASGNGEALIRRANALGAAGGR